MTAPVHFPIDLERFVDDPYPTLSMLRRDAPVAFVPQLGAVLITRHQDVTRCEKNIAVFSSDQPGGLMTVLMGQNLMRKDGRAHLAERHAIMPALSAQTARHHWQAVFSDQVDARIATLARSGRCDLVADFAMPVAAEALKAITGLTGMRAEDMNAWSQAMIDGIANYAGDPAVRARCDAATTGIDHCITLQMESVDRQSGVSLLAVTLRKAMPESSIRANIKLAISGGQNESRDAIAGAAWAMLSHPAALQSLRSGTLGWNAVFDEFVRWMSPIGMSPRRIAAPLSLHDADLEPDSRAFLMFGSANRDEHQFSDADRFDPWRDSRQHIAFGAGPHFCAGAAVSRLLVAGVALPKLFASLHNLRLQPDAGVRFRGWAFRGPLSVPVEWDI